MNDTIPYNKERKVELDGILWFVNSCGTCPLIEKKRKGRGNGTYSWCPLLELEVLNTSIVRTGCPLETR